MKNGNSFTYEELKMLDIACMSYSEKLSEITKSIPFEKWLVGGAENIDGLEARAKKYWDLAIKIAEYMEKEDLKEDGDNE